MLKQISCGCLLVGMMSCGPDPIKRASDDPWSSKQQSIKSLNDISGTPQPAMVVHGDTVRARAISILEQASISPNPRLRANAIEALRYAPKNNLDEAVRAGLVDENLGVRFVAAMMVGEAKRCDLALLLEPMLLDDSKSVQAAVICSLYQCGLHVDLNPLAEMLESEDPELRGNAALVLGMMGNQSAVGLIKHASQTTPDSIPSIRRRVINLQMAEALVKLGEKNEIEVIRAAIFSSAQEAELTALACQIAGRIGDSQIISTLESIALTPNRYPDEIRLVAASAIAEINPDKVPTETVLRFTTSEIPTLRAQSASTLGIQGNQVNLGPLAQMMKDSDVFVQIAASGAVLRIDNSDSMVIVH